MREGQELTRHNSSLFGLTKANKALSGKGITFCPCNSMRQARAQDLRKVVFPRC